MRNGSRRAVVSALAASMLTALAVAGGSSAEPARTLAPPKNETPPTISGTQRVGFTLVANPGGWSGSTITSFTYRWVRCNAQLANCGSVISNSRSYRTKTDDLGRRLVVIVTAKNKDGSREASASTGVIRERAVAPRNTVAPAISGTAKEGEILTAQPGTWTGSTPITFRYQWLRCDAAGNACTAITGATARTYAVSSADVGRTLRVRVTARNGGGNRSVITNATGVVQAGGPGGQIRLPDGRISVPIETVSLPTRLVVEEVVFSPNPVRSRTAPITIRVRVVDTRGFVVRGALVFVRATPLLTTVPPETPTATDGWATMVVRPRSAPGLVFPLARGLNVQFYVQARKAGERLLYGVTGTRLVQVRTARP